MTRLTRFCGLIFVLALAVRLTMLFPLHRYEISRTEAVRIAISLARSGTFADPYRLPTGPTAHTAPLYPALIAPLYAIWGDSLAADRGRFALNAIAASAGYALLPLIAVALGLGFWPGILAGMAGALIPLHYWPECMGDFENTFTALFLEVAFLQFLLFLRAPVFEGWRAVKTGLLWGAGLLLTPTVAPVLIGFGVVGYWKLRPPPRMAIHWLAILVASTVATLTPWLVRDYLQLGGLCFIRDDFGLELFVSNHDGATAVAPWNYSKRYFRGAHPNTSAIAALEVRQGELAFERRRLAMAFAWIGSHRLQFLYLTLSRIVKFWLAAVPRFAWVFWVVTVIAGTGWLLLFWDSRAAAAVGLGSVLIAYSAVFSFIQTDLRYQHPIWWALILLNSWTICFLFRAGAGNPAAFRSPPSENPSAAL